MHGPQTDCEIPALHQNQPFQTGDVAQPGLFHLNQPTLLVQEALRGLKAPTVPGNVFTLVGSLLATALRPPTDGPQ